MNGSENEMLSQKLKEEIRCQTEVKSTSRACLPYRNVIKVGSSAVSCATGIIITSRKGITARAIVIIRHVIDDLCILSQDPNHRHVRLCQYNYDPPPTNSVDVKQTVLANTFFPI